MKSKEEAPKAENNRIVELVENCKLVKVTERTEENGHDCWGKLEWTTHTEKHITINGKEEMAFDDWWIIHDGVNAIETRVHKPKVEYQENAIDFNYGWTRSTEKDYNNPKDGFEYRMILPSPVLEPKDSKTVSEEGGKEKMQLLIVAVRELVKAISMYKVGPNKDALFHAESKCFAKVLDIIHSIEEVSPLPSETQEKIWDEFLDIYIDTVGRKNLKEALLNKFTITRK